MLASGFDITTADKLAEVVDRSVEIVGIDRVRCLHVNDSQTPLGSNRDRHAIPGEGELGARGCAAFLSEPRFEGLPALFEGPGTAGHAPDKVDVDRLQGAAAKRPALAQAAQGRMTPAQLRRACLRQPGAFEDFPFGPETSVFKVGGKLFAISALRSEPLRVSVKCEPELAEQLRLTYPAIKPGYHLNKRHWNTIELDGSLDDALVRDLIEDSYDLVVAGLPRKRRPS